MIPSNTVVSPSETYQLTSARSLLTNHPVHPEIPDQTTDAAFKKSPGHMARQAPSTRQGQQQAELSARSPTHLPPRSRLPKLPDAISNPPSPTSSTPPNPACLPTTEARRKTAPLHSRHRRRRRRPVAASAVRAAAPDPSCRQKQLPQRQEARDSVKKREMPSRSGRAIGRADAEIVRVQYGRWAVEIVAEPAAATGGDGRRWVGGERALLLRAFSVVSAESLIHAFRATCWSGCGSITVCGGQGGGYGARARRKRG